MRSVLLLVPMLLVGGQSRVRADDEGNPATSNVPRAQYRASTRTVGSRSGSRQSTRSKSRCSPVAPTMAWAKVP